MVGFLDVELICRKKGCLLRVYPFGLIEKRLQCRVCLSKLRVWLGNDFDRLRIWPLAQS